MAKKKSDGSIIDEVVGAAATAFGGPAAGVAADKITETIIDGTAKEEPEKTESEIDTFFQNQIYQQQIQTSVGWTTIQQAMVSKVSEAIVKTKPGEDTIDMEAIEKLMELTKTMQMDTIDIMKAFKND